MTIFDLDKWSEIWQTLSRNKSRSLLTAFGVFWGIFMLTILMGGSNGFRAILEANFNGFCTKFVFLHAGENDKTL